MNYPAPRSRNDLYFVARRTPIWAMGLASMLALLLVAGSSAAAEQAYPVSSIVLEYAEHHPDHPGLVTLAYLEVELSESAEGLVGPRAGEPVVSVRLGDAGPWQLTPTAIREINRRIVEEFNQRGYAGVLVEPSPRDIDPATSADLRPEGQTQLRLLIWTGRITRLRTYASGGRVPEQDRIDNPKHRRIKARSPLGPTGADSSGDLMRLDALEDYVGRLNRHPGRRVDMSLSPAPEPGGVNVDYLVTENKPWTVYLQASNTGTDSTGDNRLRIGYEHNQFTGRDDILQFDGITGDPNELYGGFARYDAPLGGTNSRWQIFAGGSHYNADDFGIRGANFDGTSVGGGVRFFTNVYQRGDAFLDFTSGVRWDHIENDNELAQINGKDDFFLPTVGLRFERRSGTAKVSALMEVEGNSSAIAGTDTDDIDGAGGLGRSDADEDFVLLRLDTSGSIYLSAPNELVGRLGGQWAFDNRLVPNYERSAGGLYTVRGYEQATLAGDSIVLGSFEYRRHFPQRFAQSSWDLAFKAFGDAARVIYSDRRRFETNESLVGVGGGFELRWRRNLVLRGDVGWAMEEIDALGIDRGDSEVYFSITTLY